jgi:hypothetical protein
LVRSGRGGRPDLRRLPGVGCPEPFASIDSTSRRSTGTLATDSRVRGGAKTPPAPDEAQAGPCSRVAPPAGSERRYGAGNVSRATRAFARLSPLFLSRAVG